MSAPRISYEFFPPQSIEATFRLFETVNALAPTHPDFVSVTYGAGGTTRKLTHDAVGTIHKHYGLNVAAHLTCVDATREETLAIADSYADAGVSEIVALRGDPPKGQGSFSAHPEGFANSVELVEALAKTGKFRIRVGAYPDPHPEAPDSQADVDWLKRKIDAGASSAITQFFFEADTFFRFRDRCEKAGIDAEVIPGILPIEHWKGTKRFAERCGTPVPEWLDEKFEGAIADGAEARLGRDLAIDLASKLMDGGVESLHFYTLNKPALTSQVVGALGVSAAPVKPAATSTTQVA
ncbi:methylenetetrahydrofolate reductase [NAD(P)H] [Aliiroseovarius sp. PTFE2010]|uniref:methylenetetrahydrofolate reductase [NAD(P)H] n=1 Tax=Aliiroseovarius sp. PTFE2010 TaxID=3417190 RepID=UPI003CFA9905